MLTTCPNCGTNFSVPDAALGREGRKLKCAKCDTVWFQTPLRLEDDEPGAFDFAPEPEPDAAPVSLPAADDGLGLDLDLDPTPTAPAAAAAAAAEEPRLPDLDFAPEPPFGRAGRAEPIDEPPPGLMEAGAQPVPKMFAPPPEDSRHRGGVAALWAVLGLLVLGGLGGAVYYFQDALVDLVPEAGPVLTQIGLRHERLGAGLELRKAGSPERFVRNEVEVLRVCGLIVNISDRLRPVPTMKLVLLDKAGQAVQEELARPPVNTLSPQAPAPFCILRERPDPNAVEVVVVFSDQDAAKAPIARPLERAAPRPAVEEEAPAAAPPGAAPGEPALAAPAAPAPAPPPAPPPASPAPAMGKTAPTTP